MSVGLEMLNEEKDVKTRDSGKAASGGRRQG